MDNPRRSSLSGGRKGSAPIDPPKGPYDPKDPKEDTGPIWPHQSFLDWMDREFPEITSPQYTPDRDILIRGAQRAVYHRILREMKESHLRQE